MYEAMRTLKQHSQFKFKNRTQYADCFEKVDIVEKEMQSLLFEHWRKTKTTKAKKSESSANNTKVPKWLAY
jgi:hypothetical protein